MPFHIVRQDITKMQVDAIVNAANTELLMGDGVCGAIFQAAGPEQLQAACDALSPISTGRAVITPGFALPAKFVIHAAGPVYHDWEPKKSEALLRSAYLESLKLAQKNRCKSIAFPLISSGIYGYPKTEALEVASTAIRDYLQKHEMDVYLAVFDDTAFAASRELMGEVASYIDENYVSAHTGQRRDLLEVEHLSLQCAPILSAHLFEKIPPKGYPLGDLINNLDEPFNVTLLRLIDASGKTDAEVYKKANIDRKHFSKIKNGKKYSPTKRTVIAFAIALELNLEETEDLLACAGYALSHSQVFDVIVEYFIISGKYDIFEINEVLFQYDQPLLGAY